MLERLAAPAADAPPAVGGGRYRLHHRLAQGAYDGVYSATDRLTGEACAVQLLPAGRYEDRVLAAVQREAVEAAAVGHRAILAPLASGFDEDGAFYLVSAALPCEPLRARLRRGPLSGAETLALLLPVCAALQAAGAIGLHHGRISPGTILCPAAGGALLMDFGLHHLGDPSSVETAAYLPPERYQGAPAPTAQGDVFALGAVAYECLCGQRLFPGDTTAALMFQLCVAPPPVIADAALAALVGRACARGPSARIADAGALAAALREAVAGGHPSVAPVPDGEAPSAASDRRPVGVFPALAPDTDRRR